MNFAQMLTVAIGDPRRQASTDELAGIMGTLQQAASAQGVGPAVAPALLSVVGSFVRSALQDRRRAGGDAAAQAVVDRHAGLAPDPAAVDALFGGQERDRVARSVSQETGLRPNVVQALLPVVVPLVLRFLQGGNATDGPVPAAGGARANPLLGAFMDADRDGDVDLADALRMAGHFMNR